MKIKEIISAANVHYKEVVLFIGMLVTALALHSINIKADKLREGEVALRSATAKVEQDGVRLLAALEEFQKLEASLKAQEQELNKRAQAIVAREQSIEATQKAQEEKGQVLSNKEKAIDIAYRVQTEQLEAAKLLAANAKTEAEAAYKAKVAANVEAEAEAEAARKAEVAAKVLKAMADKQPAVTAEVKPQSMLDRAKAWWNKK